VSVVLCTGGRDFDDVDTVCLTLDHIADVAKLASPVSRVIVGDARGADAWVGYWARARNKLLVVYEADWAKHGKRAGILRNAQMLAESKPDIVVAFPGGRGTADMVRRAEKAGVRVWRVVA